MITKTGYLFVDLHAVLDVYELRLLSYLGLLDFVILLFSMMMIIIIICLKSFEIGGVQAILIKK